MQRITNLLIPDILDLINKDPESYKEVLDDYIRLNPKIGVFFNLLFFKEFDEQPGLLYKPYNAPPTMAPSNIYNQMNTLVSLTKNSVKFDEKTRKRLFLNLLESVNADEALVLEGLISPVVLVELYPNIDFDVLKAYFTR